MENICLYLAIMGSGLFLVLGLMGCVIPVLPGPLLSYAAMLLLLPTRYAPSQGECIAYGVTCVIVLFLDYIVPAIGAKSFTGGTAGSSLYMGIFSALTATMLFLPTLFPKLCGRRMLLAAGITGLVLAGAGLILAVAVCRVILAAAGRQRKKHQHSTNKCD